MTNEDATPISALELTGRCQLCLKNRILCRSHIVPEFCWDALYDSKHRAIEFSADPGTRAWRQKGFREPLLCSACEGHLNKNYEQYFKRLWYDQKALPTKIHDYLVHLSDLDYQRFKLFHLSVLWRAGISRSQYYRAVYLGPHAERLRKMILNLDAGPEDVYRFFGYCLVHEDSSVVYQQIVPFVRSKLDGVWVYYGCYAGCEWVFFVTSQPTEEYAEFCLRDSGTLVLARMPLCNSASVRNFVHNRRKKRKR